MKADKDRPSTWKKYDASFCTSCRANCCSMPVEVRSSDLLRLEIISVDEIDQSIKKAAKKLKKSGFISSYREGTDLFMLTQRPNGDCYFLHEKTRLCTVYDKRPDTCREFPSVLGTRVGFCPSEKK
jgi:Fe-S-cluster containining protein